MDDNKTNALALFVAAATHRWRVAVIAIVITTSAAIAYSRVHHPPLRAYATILVQSAPSADALITDMSIMWEVGSQLAVVEAVLNSQAVATQMLYELGDINDFSTEQEISWAMEDFSDRVHLINRSSGLVNIEFLAPTGEQAIEGLGMLIELFREEMLRPQEESLDASTQFIGDQLERLWGEIEAEAERLSEFRSENADMVPEVFQTNLDLYASTLGDLMATRIEAASSLGQVELARERLLAYNPDLQGLETSLNTARQELTSLESTYSSTHPLVIEARERVRSVERQLLDAEQSDSAIDIEELESLARRGRGGDLLADELLDYQAAIATAEGRSREVEELETQLDEMLETLRVYGENEQVLNQLTRTIEVKTDAYDRLLGQYQDAIISRELTLGEEARQVWVIEPPKLPPDTGQIGLQKALMGGLFAGFALAFFLIVALEFFDTSVRFQEEAAEISAVKHVITLPRLYE